MYQYTPESIYGLCLPVVKPDPGYDANGSPVEDDLSKDLIEAARDAQGG